MLLAVVQIDIVRNVLFAGRKLFFNDGVTSLANVDGIRIVDHRTVIVVRHGNFSKRTQHVQGRNQLGIRLQGTDISSRFLQKRIVKGGLDFQNFILRPQDFILILFQLGRNITLAVYEGLLANPRVRRLVLVGFRHFDVITEHIVEPDFQGGNTRLFNFALLDFQEFLLAMDRNIAQFIQFGIDPLGNHAALGNLMGGILLQLPPDFLV